MSNGLAIIAIVWGAWFVFAPEHFGEQWGKNLARFSVGYERGWELVMDASHD